MISRLSTDVRFPLAVGAMLTTLTVAHSIVADPPIAMPLLVAWATAFWPTFALLLLRDGDRRSPPRKLLAIVHLDIAASTVQLAAIGDRAWTQKLDHFRRLVRRALTKNGGREIDTAGDAFFVTFAAPREAIHFALEVVEAVRTLDLQVRAGLHMGEVEVRRGRVTGIAVHIAARVLGYASPSEVLVSRTFRDLVAGSDISLRLKTTGVLRGVAGEWELYAVDRERCRNASAPFEG